MEIKYDTPTLLYASIMDDTLKALESKFNINFFHFARRVKNMSPFSISTNRAWHLKYKEEYENNDTFMDSQKIQKYKHVYLWGSEEFRSKKEKMMHEERTKSFCIPPGISLIHENEDFIDTYSFSSSMIFQDRLNALLNQSNDLMLFGVDFSKKINPIVLEHFKKNTTKIDNKLVTPVFPKENLEKKDFQLSAYSNISERNNLPGIFTQRQMECIYCIAHGLSSTQAGKILNISKRTVESILNNAMLNTGCINRYQLIYLSTKYGLIMEENIPPFLKLKIEQEVNLYI